MDIDHREDVSAWINASTTAIRNTPGEDTLKQSHSTLGLSTPLGKRQGTGDHHGLAAIQPEPSKEDMALNSPFKLAQQIFPKKTASGGDSVKGDAVPGQSGEERGIRGFPATTRNDLGETDVQQEALQGGEEAAAGGVN